MHFDSKHGPVLHVLHVLHKCEKLIQGQALQNFPGTEDRARKHDVFALNRPNVSKCCSSYVAFQFCLVFISFTGQFARSFSFAWPSQYRCGATDAPISSKEAKSRFQNSGY